MFISTGVGPGLSPDRARAGRSPFASARFSHRLSYRSQPLTIITHILATTLGVQVMGLHGRNAALAYAFGVGVDIDHVVKAPFYLRAVGLKDKRGYYWRSSLQEPVALLWIAPLSIALGTIVPVLFFAIHVAMDYSVKYEKMPFYPYSRYVTRGWLAAIPDRVKEAILFVGLLCTISLLNLARR